MSGFCVTGAGEWRGGRSWEGGGSVAQEVRELGLNRV